MKFSNVQLDLFTLMYFSFCDRDISFTLCYNYFKSLIMSYLKVVFQLTKSLYPVLILLLISCNENSVSLADQPTLADYHENSLMPNVKFREMDTSSDTYGKDIYFENMVLTRMTTLAQNREAYSKAIESLKNLKYTYAELRNTNE
jgi:hypothetical protein